TSGVVKFIKCSSIEKPHTGSQSTSEQLLSEAQCCLLNIEDARKESFIKAMYSQKKQVSKKLNILFKLSAIMKDMPAFLQQSQGSRPPFGTVWRSCTRSCGISSHFSGDVDRFQTLKSAWGQQPDLAANETQLLRKIQLFCLMEMTFTRLANHRSLTFEEIAKSVKISVNKVEFLEMKALWVGLVRGSIDNVGKQVHMTLVQHGVLDLQQIRGMKDRLELWPISAPPSAATCYAAYPNILKNIDISSSLEFL
ncbi:hypothetical protein STEG23_035270, partial [Scotinomys teguina]